MTAQLAKRPKRQAPADRISAIMTQARTMLGRGGYESFSVTELAERCDVSEATVYRYFPTKRDLLVQVAEAWFRELLRFIPELEHQQDIYGQLLHVIRHSLAVVRQEPALSRFVLMELRSDPSYRSTPIYKMNRQFTATIGVVVRAAIAHGVFRADCDPVLVRDMIFGCIEHRTWAYLRGLGEIAVEETAVRIADIIYRGLATSPIEPTATQALTRVTAAAAALQAEVLTLQDALGKG